MIDAIARAANTISQTGEQLADDIQSAQSQDEILRAIHVAQAEHEHAMNELTATLGGHDHAD